MANPDEWENGDVGAPPGWAWDQLVPMPICLLDQLGADAVGHLFMHGLEDFLPFWRALPRSVMELGLAGVLHRLQRLVVFSSAMPLA